MRIESVSDRPRKGAGPRGERHLGGALARTVCGYGFQSYSPPG